MHLRHRDLIVGPRVLTPGSTRVGDVDCTGGVFSVNAFLKTGGITGTATVQWNEVGSDGSSLTPVGEALNLAVADARSLFSLRVPVSADLMTVIIAVNTASQLIANSLFAQLEVVDTAVESVNIEYFGWQDYTP